MLHNVQVINIIKPVGNGATVPLYSSISAGENLIPAIIKIKSNPEGIRPLINEYISYRLAHYLGIHMPRCGIATITKDSLSESHQFLSEVDLGSCFYSEQIGRAVLPNPSIINSIENKEIFEQIIVFDHIIYNKDRNPGNLLVSMSKGSKLLFVIDHSHVFKNQAIWDRGCFTQGIESNDYLDTIIMEQNWANYCMFTECRNITFESLWTVCKGYRKLITKDLLDIIINDLPKDWAIDEQVIELKSLVNYLLYRVEHLDEICKMIFDFINGGDFS